MLFTVITERKMLRYGVGVFRWDMLFHGTELVRNIPQYSKTQNVLITRISIFTLTIEYNSADLSYSSRLAI